MSDVMKKINDFASSSNISPDALNNLFNMINNNSNSSKNENSSDSSNTNSSGIDFDTIIKMKSIIDKMNTKDDPRSNLLRSLKPYLNDSRKSKIDQYIQLMNMSKVLEIFPFNGGESKKNDR